ELCELIKELSGYEGEIKLDPTKPDGAAYKTVDGTRGEQLLGWKPEVDFREGVAQAIKWYEENH
ncbi:MAG TPA: GDP-L-fucose synthase, partial [Saprospiraceae bacterium]|nr:GDP-L-fucose synthase [Saprospiraceae bacterium]